MRPIPSRPFVLSLLALPTAAAAALHADWAPRGVLQAAIASPAPAAAAGRPAARPRPPLDARELSLLDDLRCMPHVARAFDGIWLSANAEARLRARREMGLRIDFHPEARDEAARYRVVLAEPGEHARMEISITAATIAIAHTHLSDSEDWPSEADLRSPVPNFVLSRGSLHATDPGRRAPGGGADSPCRRPGRGACFRLPVKAGCWSSGSRVPRPFVGV